VIRELDVASLTAALHSRFVILTSVSFFLVLNCCDFICSVFTLCALSKCKETKKSVKYKCISEKVVSLYCILR